MRVKKIDFQILTLQVVLFFLLSISYYFIEAVDYVHLGFKRDLSVTRFFISIFLVVGLTVHILRADRRDFLKAILLCYCTFFMLPNLIFFQFFPGYSLKIFFSYFIVYFLIFALGGLYIRPALVRIPVDRNPFGLLLVALLLSLPFIVIYLPTIDLSNLLLQNIYETRSAHSEMSTPYTSYLYSALTKFLLPVIIIISLLKRNKLLLVGSVSLLIFLFLCGAHKSVLFFLALVLLLYFFDVMTKVRNLIAVMILLTIFAQIAAVLFSDLLWEAIFVQRAFFLNSLLDTFYIEYFSNNYIYWSDSFLGRFIQYPYEAEPAYMIGKVYFNNPDNQANNGIVSDGLINFGMRGVFFNAIIVGLIFALINSLQISSRFFGVFFIALITLRNSPLPISLLTHGLFMMILISVYVLKDSELRYRTLNS